MKTVEQAAQEYAEKINGDNIGELGDISVEDFKAGVEFAQSWISVEDELPLAYETGDWDGKRSDYVLAKNKWADVYIARTYEGISDGSKFCDFADRDDSILSHIVEWRPIEYK